MIDSFHSLDDVFGLDRGQKSFEGPQGTSTVEEVPGHLTEDMKKQISQTMTGRKRGKYKPRKHGLTDEQKETKRRIAREKNYAARLQTPDAISKMAKTKKGQPHKRDASGRFSK